jgi:hypothetical protein
MGNDTTDSSFVEEDEGLSADARPQEVSVNVGRKTKTTSSLPLLFLRRGLKAMDEIAAVAESVIWVVLPLRIE